MVNSYHDEAGNERILQYTQDVKKKKFVDEPLVFSVTSGKGGVGKTLTTINLAVAARHLGLKVLVFDGDLGLANVDVVLGLQARYNIRDVLDGNAGISDIILKGPLDVDVIPSGSGISSLSQLSFAQKQILRDSVRSIEKNYDVILIDTGAGISDNVLHFNLAADFIVVVTTPEPHAMTDAYALIKVLNEYEQKKKILLLVNQVRSAQEGTKVYERISEVATRFIEAKIDYLGHVPFDPQVGKNILQRCVASEKTSCTVSGQAWNRLARELFHDVPQQQHMISRDVWRDLLWTNVDVSMLRMSI